MSKHANHMYTDHQNVVPLVLRQQSRKSYRDFCEVLEICTEIQDELGLRRVPLLEPSLDSNPPGIVPRSICGGAGFELTVLAKSRFRNPGTEPDSIP